MDGFFFNVIFFLKHKTKLIKMFPYLILCFSNITKSKTKTFLDFMRVPRELSGVGGLVPQEKKQRF